jgi:aminoglycoside phosphotransferase
MTPAHPPPFVTLETLHEGTEHLAINTFFNRLLTLLALKTTARFYKRDGPCVCISKHKIVKSGRFVHLTEAATLKFVAEHTSFPVPKVYCSFVRKNRAYIVMERIQGEHIPAAWDKLSEESQQKIFDQLREFVRELRSLKPPRGTGVESCVG